ncbi:hypothetical protein [Mycolicibacterium peregrinum]
MPLSAETMADIRSRAKELADAAPPLSTQQAHLLTSLHSRYPNTTKEKAL